MTATFETIGLGHLDRLEKRSVADQLWREANETGPLTQEEKVAEMLRRKAEAEANPGSGILWDDLYAQLLAEYPE